MKDKIIESLKQKEKDLAVYFAYVNDRSNPEKYRSIVSFKLMNEMMAYEALHEFVPEHVPESTTATIISGNLGNLSKFVSVQDGKIRVSQEYEAMLEQRDSFIKNKTNGN